MLHKLSTGNVGGNWAKKVKSVNLFVNGQNLQKFQKQVEMEPFIPPTGKTQCLYKKLHFEM